jgi:hypothetical protein
VKPLFLAEFFSIFPGFLREYWWIGGLRKKEYKKDVKSTLNVMDSPKKMIVRRLQNKA